MQSQSVMNGWLLGIMGAIVFMAAGASYVITLANRSRESIPVYYRVPEFDFVGHTGGSFGLEDMKGSLSVVDFMFTSCVGACPVMSSKMQELYLLYNGSEKVRFVSYSVDPEIDTLPVLQEYAAQYGITDEQWTFVRGPIRDIKRLSEKGFRFAVGTLPMGHSTKFVLVDQEGMIRGYYDVFDEDMLNLLKEHIRVLASKL